MLYDKLNNDYLGTISDEDLQFLIDNLEEESMTDDDYYIDKDVFEFLKEKGMSADLVKMMELALGNNENVEIKYKRG